jgi:putative hydrolase of the HAD superfamily
MSAGVRDRLDAMRRDSWKVAVVTNGESGVQEATVERIGLAALIDACVVSGAVGVGKPDPRIFELASERCGVSLDGAWMVGDAEVDVLGADRVGVRSVWLTRGRRWTRTDVTPTLIADTLDGALARIT